MDHGNFLQEMVKSGIMTRLYMGNKVFLDEKMCIFCVHSPGEFPWSCLLLTEENGFVGNCALIPGGDLEKIEQRGYSPN